ncbi:Holliday junction DNA helicase RuvA [Candidatus Roizmanbacteria bacterium RIFCSPHIGHO2_01_FULL_39_12c]|uniref:Holliday junction branch migration complex subunit RuvA n=1 Tax=Candidatus Roizmanbacteria bacterium RIFCSPHIGHO2_01_FULL_39_12c TaxID=1802031 RepID=A0A1F7GEJ8_9BACT|nr:MAG: Holliday junction DNA helicase RuvA [Candidatus Roizmanbacteria bacterium RIFCSPHIGHO2_01_FULL_39_12c]OGK48105.1 MAG: Holliday junction DNA helicase RuvA [Candidatus Roizmanbacteria bacterium RIFCSPLOWO2_01_FULL_40_13]
MIGKLKGKLIEIEGNQGLIETTGGVCYQAYLTPSVIGRDRIQDTLEIYTYLQVRDDALVLFGFETKKESDFFKMLLGIAGIGPKTAFTVISFTKIDELISAVKDNNSDFFAKIPGLGKKSALKIMLELSHKLSSEFQLEKMYLSEEDKTVVDALISLGFKGNEAKKILTKIDKKLSIEDKVKQALKKVKV